MARAGFIGVGNMGEPMAANLAKGGCDVVVHDADRARAERVAAAIGATAAADLAEIAGCDVVVVMLPDGKIVQSVLLEEDDGAFLKAAKPGTVVIDMSSSEPPLTRITGQALAEHGLALVDAPVSGGVPRAVTGELTLMIGTNDADALAKARPFLELMGARLFEVGPLGAGHAMKALNNFAAAATTIAVAEALAIGKRFGLAPETIIDVMNVSTGRSFVTEVGFKEHVITGKFATGFALGLLTKDVRIAAELGEEVGVDAPLTRLARERWAAANAARGPGVDHTEAVPAWFEELGSE